jgi:hypothetical protein
MLVAPGLSLSLSLIPSLHAQNVTNDMPNAKQLGWQFNLYAAQVLNSKYL